MLYCIFFSNSEITQSGHEIEVHFSQTYCVIHDAAMVVSLCLDDQCNCCILFCTHPLNSCVTFSKFLRLYAHWQTQQYLPSPI